MFVSALSALSSFGTRHSYGARLNLPNNFDPNIGAKSRKKPVHQPDKAHPSKSASNPSISDPSSPSLTATEQDTPSLPLSAENSVSSTPLKDNPTNPHLELTNTITAPTMTVGSFPPLSSVREIREFDGSAEKLIDFLSSVEAHLAAYNLPLETGGIVHGDIDEGWTYVTATEYIANTQLYKTNYNYGQHFCTLLAKRFTSSAREWWINRQNASIVNVQNTVEPVAKPNCWRIAPIGYCPDGVKETSFRDLIISQFLNPLDRELAMSELGKLHWHPSSENFNTFRTRVTTLLNRAGIHD